MSDKTYLDQVFVKEHKFANGGKILKIGIADVNQFVDQILSHKKKTKDGKPDRCDLIISRRKEQTQYVTHSIYIDDYVSKQKNQDFNDIVDDEHLF